MLKITKRIKLDFARALSPVTVFAKQGDESTRFVEISPLENGQAYTIPEGITVAFACRKPDGHQVLIDGATSESGYPKIDPENNLIIVELTDQTLAAAGTGIAAVSLKTDGKVLSTQNFLLQIENGPLIGSQVESADEYQGYIAALELISDALEKSEQTVVNENERAAAEEIRKANESARVEAEKRRAQTFAGWKEQIDGITADNAQNRENIAQNASNIENHENRITANDQLISRNSKRITNIEKHLSPSPFVTDDTMSYVKDVPENALPYAEVQKIGGMTRKCTNLLPYPYVHTTRTVEGITFTANKDGSITVNGTSTNFASFTLYNKEDAFAGCYLKATPSGGGLNSLYVRAETADGTRYRDSGAGVYLPNAVRYIQIVVPDKDITISNLTIYPMLNMGDTALPYEPYFEGLRSAPVTSADSVGANGETEIGRLDIPEAVQALDGYGEGNPDDVTEYNSIQWNENGSVVYSHKGNIVDGAWVCLATPEVTDISDLITPDNLIPVEGNGTITFANEYGYDVPSSVEYMLTVA